jgi:hypothetical protein
MRFLGAAGAVIIGRMADAAKVSLLYKYNGRQFRLPDAAAD